jgi:hypothetical protein
LRKVSGRLSDLCTARLGCITIVHLKRHKAIASPHCGQWHRCAASSVRLPLGPSTERHCVSILLVNRRCSATGSAFAKASLRFERSDCCDWTWHAEPCGPLHPGTHRGLAPAWVFGEHRSNILYMQVVASNNLWRARRHTLKVRTWPLHNPAHVASGWLPTMRGICRRYCRRSTPTCS